MVLYGFATEEERELFEMLTGVQGVGPKVALAVLGGGGPREVIRSIAAGDARRLQGAPGVGKRIAERIVAELREKVGVDLPGDGGPIVVARSDAPHELARAGLLELGYESGEADRLLSRAAGETAEELLASALRGARG
jgi:Holliday junction DNA helicase RuvA